MIEPQDDHARRNRERRARATVAQRVADYYNSLLNGLDMDADAFFERVMQAHGQPQAALQRLQLAKHRIGHPRLELTLACEREEQTRILFRLCEGQSHSRPPHRTCDVRYVPICRAAPQTRRHAYALTDLGRATGRELLPFEGRVSA